MQDIPGNIARNVTTSNWTIASWSAKTVGFAMTHRHRNAIVRPHLRAFFVKCKILIKNFFTKILARNPTPANITNVPMARCAHKTLITCEEN